MSDFIPLSVPSIQGNEWKYIRECLDEEWVSSAGKYVDLFEKKIADYTNAKYAIACINGTAALHISLLIAGVKNDDEIIVPTLTFIAPINAVKYCNANPVFMDADEYFNIDIYKTIDFIKNETIFKSGYSYNKRTEKRVSAIIPVHVFGNAVDLEPLVIICKERNIIIIEDATESLGTVYNTGEFSGKFTGTIGQLGCFSFNGNKIITTGGGGIITTNDEHLADRARYLTTQAKDDSFNYIHNEVGYNYRLTNIQAAMGVAQLEQLPKYLEIKRNNYLTYKDGFKNIDGLFFSEGPHYAVNNHWMYALQIKDGNSSIKKKDLMSHLEKEQIECRPIWLLNHKQKMYKNCYSYNIEKAEELYNHSFNIPCSVNLAKNQIKRIFENIEKWKK